MVESLDTSIGRKEVNAQMPTPNPRYDPSKDGGTKKKSSARN